MLTTKDTVQIQKMFERASQLEIDFVEPVTLHRFRASPYQIINAKYEINRQIHEEGVATVFDFLSHCNVDVSELDEKDKDCGWGIDCISQMGSDFVELDYIFVEDKNGCAVGIQYEPYPCECVFECFYDGKIVDCAV